MRFAARLCILVIPLVLASGLASAGDGLDSAGAVSAESCKALADYRDGPLFNEWDAALAKMAKYRDALQTVQRAQVDLANTKSDLEMGTALGTMVEATYAITNLAQNSAAVVGLDKLLGPTYNALQKLKDAAKVASAANAEDLSKAVAEIAANETEIGRVALLLHDLSEDKERIIRSKEESAQIQQHLSDQIGMLDRGISRYEESVDRLRNVIRELEASKNQIDLNCANQGCPTPGSAARSRKGTVSCFVNVGPATCPGCKEGWRHRCESTPGGSVAWRPLEECLSNELKKAKDGASGQQAAASLFAAQAHDLASAPTEEQRAAERRRNAADFAAYTSANRQAPAPVHVAPSGGCDYQWNGLTTPTQGCRQSAAQGQGNHAVWSSAPAPMQMGVLPPDPSTSARPRQQPTPEPICDVTGTRMDTLSCIQLRVNAQLCKQGHREACGH